MSVSPRRLRLDTLEASAWPAAGAIYQAGIDGGAATFEERAPDWERFHAKCGGYPAVVARDDAAVVLGWAALSPVSSRCVYRGVGAVSIYVSPEHSGTGVGRALLDELIERAEQAGIWTIEAGIFPENAASIALHERCGFRLVGVRERIGQMPDGSWRDVRLYERRSDVVGS